MALELVKICHFCFVHCLIWTVIIWSSPNLLKIFVGKINRSSMIISQMPEALQDYCPWIGPNLPFKLCPLSNLNNSHLTFTKLAENVCSYKIFAKNVCRYKSFAKYTLIVSWVRLRMNHLLETIFTWMLFFKSRTRWSSLGMIWDGRILWVSLLFSFWSIVVVICYTTMVYTI